MFTRLATLPNKRKLVGVSILTLIALVSVVSLINNLHTILPSRVSIVPNPEDQVADFFIAEVVRVLETNQQDLPDGKLITQQIEATILNGGRKDQLVEVEVTSSSIVDKPVETNDKIVLIENTMGEEISYTMVDYYRLAPMLWIGVIFIFLTIIIAGIRGLTSLIGLLSSIIVLANWVIPSILQGYDPFLVSFIGAFVIAVLSLYLAHGFNRKASVALASTLLTIFLAALVAQIFTVLAKLTGLGSEEAGFLQVAVGGTVDIRGLIVGGMVIGALGILDDITVGQTYTVAEISKANHELGFWELVKRGLNVGREHIASLVNSLALAYVGAAMPLFLLFYKFSTQPLWVNFNMEYIAEEVIRTLVGSMALVMAVPIATFLSAYFLQAHKLGGDQGENHHHHHGHSH